MGGIATPQVHDLNIKFQKADGELMFRRADNVGLGENSSLFNISGPHEKQAGRRAEYIFAVGKNKQLISELCWPRNDADRRDLGHDVYAWNVLWATRDHASESFSDSIHDKVEWLVWVTVEAWHKDSGSDEPPEYRFGEFCERFVTITVYGKPNCGFHKLQEESNLYEHLYLDSKTFMKALFEKNRDVTVIGGRVNELCQFFADEVYFNGMKAILDGKTVRGASGQFGPVKVLAAEMCGYHRVMLEGANAWISYQIRPGEKHMYTLGMGGTLPQLRQITKMVIKMWNSDPKARESFKPDDKVSVM